MANSLQYKVALVTGAASGIGRMCAELFGSEGAQVMVADLNEVGGRETVGNIVEAGGQAAFVKVDVTNAQQVEAMVKATVERFGGLDVVMNNAGIAETGGGLLHEVSEEVFDRVIATNLRSVFLGMKYTIPALLARGSGRIINTASIYGLVGGAGSPSYTAAKFGVVGLTKSAALAYAPANIQVNCICPGFIDTPLLDPVRQRLGNELDQLIIANTPAGRLGKAEEIAQTVLFLATAPNFITGSALVIDGGYTAR